MNPRFAYKVCMEYDEGVFHSRMIPPHHPNCAIYSLRQTTHADPVCASLGFGLSVFKSIATTLNGFALSREYIESESPRTAILKCWVIPLRDHSEWRYSISTAGLCVNGIRRMRRVEDLIKTQIPTEIWPYGTILCESVTPYYRMSWNEIVAAQKEEKFRLI